MKNTKSRRSFIKVLGAGTVGTTAALSSRLLGSHIMTEQSAAKSSSLKAIKIGIIGAENSHTIGYGRLFNVEKKFPGVEVVYVWGETEELARRAMEKGAIPNMVRDPNEMLGKIDALIVDHRHAKYHLAAALPFIKEGIPAFIDKPFCYRVSEGKEFLSLARSLGTPVSSWSTAAHNDRTLDLKRKAEQIGPITNFVSFGPVDIESQWGGVFFYGVHAVDQLLNIFGDRIEKVRVSRNGKNATASVVFDDGMLATLVFLTQSSGRLHYAETGDGLVELKSDVQEADPPKSYVDMVEMFRTGKEPRSHERILFSIAVLEALERSVRSDTWEIVSV